MKYLKKYIRLYRIKRIQINTHPIEILRDRVEQIAALYAYQNSKDYKEESQRDILNLRMAELKNEINQQLNFFNF